MKLDKRSEEDLASTRPGYGIIFIKAAGNGIRSTEFYPSINRRLRTAPLPNSEDLSEDLHEWIESQHRESQRESKEGNK